MARENVQVELSFYLRAEKPGDVPLEVYDALYYSGSFEPIYRLQGDMVLGAYYREGVKGDGKVRRFGRRLLKELTIDLKERPGGREVRVENLMPVFDEEKAFYRDPKVRISTKTRTATRYFNEAVAGEVAILSATEGILLKIDKLGISQEARLVITLLEGAFDTGGMKEVHGRLAAHSVRSSATKHIWNMDFKKDELSGIILPEAGLVLKSK